MLTFILSAFLSASLVTMPAHADPTHGASFHEAGHFDLGGDGGWDYLISDSADHRLYIARSNRIMIVDSDSGKLIGEVNGLEGAHGVALVKSLGRGFASSGRSGEVVAFDLKTWKTLGRVKTAENPDAIIYDESSKKIFAFNGKSRSVSVVDPATLAVEGSLALPGKPEFAATDEAGHVFVNIEDKSELITLDSKHLKILSTHSLAPCEEPTGLSIDRKSKRLIIGCGNRLAVIVSTATGTVLQNFPVGEGVDATAFDSANGLAFVSAGEGTLSVLARGPKGFRGLQTLPTRKGARTLAVDALTGKIFLPFAQFAPMKEAQAGQPHARPSVMPGTFSVLVISP